MSCAEYQGLFARIRGERYTVAEASEAGANEKNKF